MGRPGDPTDQSDLVLAAVRAGGDWAWEALYSDAAPAVRGYLRAKGAPDADDLVGEVFVHAVKDLGRFEGDYRQFKAWLLTIAHRRLVDDFRKRARNRETTASDEELRSLTPYGDVEKEGLDHLDADDAVASIRRLTPDQRDVLLLRLVSDLTLEEVSHALGKSITAVKALQRRGLMNLHRERSKKGVSP